MLIIIIMKMHESKCDQGIGGLSSIKLRMKAPHNSSFVASPLITLAQEHIQSSQTANRIDNLPNNGKNIQHKK